MSTSPCSLWPFSSRLQPSSPWETFRQAIEKKHFPRIAHPTFEFFVQTVIIENAMDENSTGYVNGFDGDGYISLSITYAVSCACDFLAPSAMAVLGLKMSMVLASTTYALFIATFYALMKELLYAGSAVMGMGNALIWVSQVLL